MLLLHGQRSRFVQVEHGKVGEVVPLDVAVQDVSEDLLELCFVHVATPNVDGANDEVGLDAAVEPY